MKINLHQLGKEHVDLPGTNLLQTLVKPNNMTLTQSYEVKRDLLIGQLYKRSNTSVASRSYSYDTLGRPVTRSTSKDGSTVNDSFGYNSRSELNIATVNNEAYAYDYDNIGNREMAQEAAESATTYESNQLNQYTAIGDFEPTYDDAGNQTKVKTSTGIWLVTYNAENRPTLFTNTDSGTIVECSYDYMGRRATKKVTVNGNVTLHQRFLYRGYLQIACCDLTRSNHPCLWLITWDPTQPVATRPLAIQKDGTWYTYGWDLTKNICEVYGQHGYIRTNYSYSPFSEVMSNGDVTQPIQWSAEFYDSELGFVYYNYRYYSVSCGRWIQRDLLSETDFANIYDFCGNTSINTTDYLGLRFFKCPEESFASIDEAGKAAIATWNPVSIQENLEHGGYICECRAWLWTCDAAYYCTHTRGAAVELDLAGTECPWYDRTVADWHTHAAYDPGYDNEEFSRDDTDTNDAGGFPGYLGTPSGAVRRYTPGEGVQNL